MPGFAVHLPAVDALSFRVAAAASDVRSVEGKLAMNACIDTGYAALSTALTEFGEFWQSFIDGAAGAVDSTASAMSAAATAYHEVDSTVMADPALTATFMQNTLSGNDGLNLLLAPLIGN